MTATRLTAYLVATAVWVLAFGNPALADPLAIYDIQYTTDPDGSSPHGGNLVACTGGIVTHTASVGQARLYLQDPAHADGWGAIMVKDWTGELLSGVSVGDWLSLTNVLVEEYRGNTILQYDGRYDPDFVVESSGNAVPAAKLVSMAEIAAPVEEPAAFFLVANHDAEKYESMWLTVVDGNVTEMDLGKADDNYSLHGATADVWASDYLNVDRAGDYHPDVFIGQRFASVTGILEQYTKIESTYAWDYYQLLTTSASDLIIPEPSTIMLLTGSMAVLSVMRSSRRRRGPFPCRGGKP